jgi:vacuolar protein sorting-associated protein 13A/C
MLHKLYSFRAIHCYYLSSLRRVRTNLPCMQVWRNCAEDYRSPVSIWLPRPRKGYVALGCVAAPSFVEPRLGSAFCVNERFTEDAEFEEQIVWASSDAYPWGCYVYQVQSRSLQFIALRLPKEQSALRPKKISESYAQQASEIS